MSLLLFLASAAFAEPLVAVVVVDQEAREQGYALEIDGWLVNDALPVDVAKGEVLRLVDPAGRTEELDLAPGEAWEVTGPDGEAWMSLLDDEIRTDLIAVRGPAEAIGALAKSLDARIEVREGVVYLKGDDILLDAGWVDDELALQVDEVTFVRVRVREDDAQPARPAGRPAIAAVPAVLPVAVPAVAPTPVAAPEIAAPAADPVIDPRERTRGRAKPEPKRPPPGRVVGEAAWEAYAGRHMCRGEMMWLHPDGTYGFRGVVGYWQVVSPGIVRLESLEHELWWRAAIEPTTGHCRDAWSPDPFLDQRIGRVRDALDTLNAD
ncbi:MAG: hypothetical protein H6737_10445 [Alphaproteobacteria bacterium]|nr:hypothetical protein [Alphaproteobacteria bacterium]